MSESPTPRASAENELGGLLEAIRDNAGMAIAIGVIMLIAGIAALAAPAVVALSITIIVGFTLAVSGIGQCALAFRAGAFGQGLMIFVVGALIAIGRAVRKTAES